nr:unnamed protein product [Digitaria exilis]
MALLNCLLAAWYGLPFVSPNNIPVSTVNGAGAAIEVVYVIIFLAFASSQRTRLRMLVLASAAAAVFAALALVSMLALQGERRKLLCGIAATVCSICMYGSPLSIMRLVVKTKSVEYMPFLLSLAVFLSGTSWLVYGLLGRDPFVVIPSAGGSFLGAVQLILYAIYRNSSGKASAAAADEDMEMMASNTKQDSNKVKVAHEADGGAGKEDRLV